MISGAFALQPVFLVFDLDPQSLGKGVPPSADPVRAMLKMPVPPPAKSDLAVVVDRVKQVLLNENVQAQIKSALESEANRLMEQQLDPDGTAKADSAILAEAVKNAGLKAYQEDLRKQVEQSRAYQDIKSGMEQLGKAFSESEVGVWIDKNRTWVIVGGIPAAVAGVSALYASRLSLDRALHGIDEGQWQDYKRDFERKNGFEPTVFDKLLSQAVESASIPMIHLGTIAMTAQVVSFKPSEGTGDLKLTATGKWERIQAKLDISGGVFDPELRQTGTKGVLKAKGGAATEVVVGLGHGVSMTATGQASTEGNSQEDIIWKAGLGFALKHSGLDVSLMAQVEPHSAGLSGEIRYAAPILGLPTTVGVYGKTTMGGRNTYDTGLKLTIDWP